MNFRRLIYAEEACMVRTQEICRIDFDPIIAAQDWDMQGRPPMISMMPEGAGRLIVASHFVMGGKAMEVDFHFADEAGGGWAIDDVSSPDRDAGPWDLAGMLTPPD